MHSEVAYRATRAVVVDDSSTMRSVLRRALEALAFDVVEYPDGEACVQAFPYETPPAIAFVDLHMPGMDGIDLIGRLRGDRRCDDLYIVMVTSEVATEVRQLALARGADAFLAKPLEVRALRSGLEQLGFAWMEPV